MNYKKREGKNMVKSLLGTISLCFIATIIVFSSLTAYSFIGSLSVSKLYGNNMVIQRGSPIKIQGKASLDTEVEVGFNDKIYTTQSQEGSWEITLPSMTSGGPYDMLITSGKEEIKIENILIGDVWICSGQSNMEWMVENSYDISQDIIDTEDTNIRHFKVPRATANTPEIELAGGEWKVNAINNTGEFTAVGYFFAKQLRKHQDVPIGLINASWGGSRIEAWMSASCFENEDFDQEIISMKDEAEKTHQGQLEDWKKIFPEISMVDQGTLNDKYVWADPNFDDADWVDIKVPSTWEYMFDGLDGIGWYRTTFDLNDEEAKHGIELGLGQIDDSDESFVNGVRVGGIFGAYNAQRVYQVNSEILKPGRNVITVRVEDGGGGGGMAGEATMLYFKTSQRKESLAGTWKFRIGAYSNLSFSANQIPTLLYNKMIHPLHSFPIKGVLWYQGESNTNNIQEAKEYGNLFTSMIEDWRKRWNQEDFPFLYVQLANFMEAQSIPAESNWATLRNAQAMALQLPNVGQAVIIDIGEKDDIHPKNKYDVGKRLSLLARKIAYGEELISSGPTYKSHQINGSEILISFDNIGTGLVSQWNAEGWLDEFSIAGDDGVFVWAKAKIEGDKVSVWSDNIKRPTQVRYAWADNPEKANFYNQQGLPASPFKTSKISRID